MSEQTGELNTIAIAYDFDGTLSPGNMQQHSFLPSLGITPDEFWPKVAKLTRDNDMSGVLAYMYMMLHEAQAHDAKINRDAFQAHGEQTPLFEGVEEYFSMINRYANSRGMKLEHYIISSGQKDILRGTAIYDEFEAVYASEYLYDANDVAIWPALAIDYTSKMQYLFRINKGVKNVWDATVLNEYMADNERPVPFRNMMFIGDGETDVPALKTIKMQGGKAIAVYDPAQQGKEQTTIANKLVTHGRADFIAPADYREGSKLVEVIKASIDEMAARTAVKRLQAQGGLYE